jgi:RNA polymerase sigma factor (sigma-70 family)
MSTSCEGSVRRSIPAEALERAGKIIRLRLARWFRRSANPRLGGRFGLSDLVQDAKLRIVKEWPSFEEKQKTKGLRLSVWVTGVAIEVIGTCRRVHEFAQRRTVYREAKSTPRSSGGTAVGPQAFLATDTPSPCDRIIQEENVMRLREALDQLDPRDRAIVTAYVCDGTPHAQIAADLGIREATERKRHVRALRKLRDRLVEMEHDERRTER